MPKNEDGEFELILANRQLLSVFFIVVILLGVFFTMGYIVGRNSTPMGADVASGAKTDKSRSVDSGPPPVDSRPAPVPAAEAPAKEAAPVETAPQRPIETAPQKAEAESPAPEPAKPVAARPESAKTESSKADSAKAAKAAKAAAKAAPAGHPASGQSYLQLAATSRHEAEIMVDVLRKKGFKSMTAEIEEKPGTFRVLVGPITDVSSANKMRADLQGAGFPGNAAIRRTF